jgi:hypothetical protein
MESNDGEGTAEETALSPGDAKDTEDSEKGETALEAVEKMQEETENEVEDSTDEITGEAEGRSETEAKGSNDMGTVEIEATKAEEKEEGRADVKEEWIKKDQLKEPEDRLEEQVTHQEEQEDRLEEQVARLARLQAGTIGTGYSREPPLPPYPSFLFPGRGGEGT